MDKDNTDNRSLHLCCAQCLLQLRKGKGGIAGCVRLFVFSSTSLSSFLDGTENGSSAAQERSNMTTVGFGNRWTKANNKAEPPSSRTCQCPSRGSGAGLRAQKCEGFLLLTGLGQGKTALKLLDEGEGLEREVRRPAGKWLYGHCAEWGVVFCLSGK
jgi:hypothetical protein